MITPAKPLADDPFFHSQTLGLALEAIPFSSPPGAGRLALTGDGQAAIVDVTDSNPRRARLTTIALCGDHADSGKSRLQFYDGASLSGRVRVRLSYGPINAVHAHERTVTLKVAHVRRDRQEPTRITGLTAEREGGVITVRWAVEHPPETQAYFVTGAPTRGWNGEPPAFDWTYSTSGNRRFTVKLKDTPDLRYVTLRDLYKTVRRTVPVR